ncbi:SIR2 family protein [Citricoccus nitrophenolicus]
MKFEEALIAHLSKVSTSPFLFVGSGLSRRYMGSDTWQGLLGRFSDAMGRPYARYSSAADGDYPEIATRLARDFFDHWWDREEYADSRDIYSDPLSEASPLKIEISNYMANLVSNIPESGLEAEELSLLAKAKLQGVITTNYDPLLEHLYPDYKVFVGQDELMFTDPAGVGEIYKIHGSHEAPESLVLTAEDFEVFNDKNPYLVAKLLTLFVEHPVIFLGYSLSDPNVRQILTSIAKVVSPSNIDKLRDRLIFIQWDPRAQSPTLNPTFFSVESVALPIHEVSVPNFMPVFRALGSLKERIPPPILRRFKNQITELVLTSDPEEKTYVRDINEVNDMDELEIIVGVGLRRQLGLSNRGLVGLNRHELLVDVLKDSLDYLATASATTLVEEVLPKFIAGRTNTPIYKYLRAAHFLTRDGSLVSSRSVDPKLAERISAGQQFFQPQGDYVFARNKREKGRALITSASNMEAFISETPLSDLSLGLSFASNSDVDLTTLQQRLLSEVAQTSAIGTDLAKTICLYDYFKYAQHGSTHP